jgi:hypothetical protein
MRPATLPPQPTPPANRHALPTPAQPSCPESTATHARTTESFHDFIVSLTPTGVHFSELHFISFHFNESALK